MDAAEAKACEGGNPLEVRCLLRKPRHSQRFTIEESGKIMKYWYRAPNVGHQGAVVAAVDNGLIGLNWPYFNINLVFPLVGRLAAPRSGGAYLCQIVGKAPQRMLTRQIQTKSAKNIPN